MLRRVSRKSTFYSCRGYAVISVILRRLCSIILWSRHWSVSEGGPFFWLPREECGPHGPHCCCSVVTSCPNLCNPMDSSTPGFPVLHYLPELAQSHARCISDSIQSPHLLLSSSPSAFNLFQHHGERWMSTSILCQLCTCHQLYADVEIQSSVFLKHAFSLFISSIIIRVCCEIKRHYPAIKYVTRCWSIPWTPKLLQQEWWF